MGSTKEKADARVRRKKRIRKRVKGTPDRPRLTVFRSARHIYAQIIDDTIGKTIVSASSLEKDLPQGEVDPETKDGNKALLAGRVGRILAERAKENGVEKVVFDRNGFMYHGRVKAVSEGARKAGLSF